MFAFKLIDPGLPPEPWDPLDSNHSDEQGDKPVEDDHDAKLDCPGYVYSKEQCRDLFQSHGMHIARVIVYFNQPQCNRLAKNHIDQGMPHEQSLVWVVQGPRQRCNK